jgi:tRNA G18 (ribose-2'-O)-methylase SpoU
VSAGFFEIGIVSPKTETNVGGLFRSAYQLGAAGVFVVGRRYERMSSDTYNTPNQIPLRQFLTFDDFLAARPFAAPLVVVEQGGVPLHRAKHPRRAVYVLGAEDNGVPRAVLDRADEVISIESVRANSFNVAVAGALVMYDRLRFFRRLEAIAEAV